MANERTRTSKFLSLVLRHRPESIGLTLDANGWANVDELLRCMAAQGEPVSRELLEQVVLENDKQRFIFNDDGQRIRANQGHSVDVDLALKPLVPPERLFHGTATRFLDSIRRSGLISGNRRHVHLSADEATAVNVGRRHGKPVVLTVDSQRMSAAGHLFYRSENEVWLADSVPVAYLGFPETA